MLTIQVAQPDQEVPGSGLITGSPGDVAASLGMRHIQIFLMTTIPATVEGFGAVLERIDRTSVVAG